MKTSQSTQDYTQSNLPDGTRARFGKGAINDIQFSPDGNRLAVASSIGIWLYDMKTYHEVALLTGHTRSVSSVAYSPNGHLLASGSEDDTVRLWDAKRGVPLKALETTAFQSYGIYDLVFQSDRRILATGGCTDLVGEDLEVHEERCIFFCEVELDLSEIERDSRTMEHDVYIKNPLQHTGALENVVFSGDGAMLASGSEDGTVRLWDTKREVLLKTLIKDHDGFAPTKTVESIAFSSDGRTLAVGRAGKVWLWGVEHGELQKTLDAHILGGAYSICFSPDGSTLASSSGFNNISLWDVTTGKHLKTFHGHIDSVGDHVASLAFNPDGKILASGSSDGTVLLWDVDIAEYKSTSATRSIVEPAFTSNIITGTDSVIPIEKKAASQNRESQIRQICTERDITTLVHFTRGENLQSILLQGLLGRSHLETRGQDFLFNDADRADWHPEANCLSISFPNYQMFWRIRRKTEEIKKVKDSQWIVLLLDAKVLWELDCAFCQDNAARKAVSSTSLEDRKRPDALEAMFGDFYNIRHQDLLIPKNYPTHPEAEVLVFDPIPMRYIKAIYFWDADARDSWLPHNINANYEIFCTNRPYFKYRSDYETWRKENFNNKGIPLSYFNIDDDDGEIDRRSDLNDDDIPF